MRAALILSLGLLAGCATVPFEGTVPERRATPALSTELPAMKVFASTSPAPTTKSRTELAEDFLDLTFLMESGRALPIFTRFEGPIRVAVAGANTPPSLMRDLQLLMGRMQREAGIDIAPASSAATANLIVETLPRRRLQRYVPQAACFVVPNVSSWTEFTRNRRSSLVDWSELQTRTRAAVFIPNDVSPQEVRDCLHEEIAQAIGPLNDLYRLPDSIFNDDNFHMVLTQFDMLMLRIAYAPELQSGMSRADVAARLPRVLARVAGNRPVGGRGQFSQLAPRAWVDAIETALGPGARPAARLAAAQRAVNIAKTSGLGPLREGFSYYALGRLSLGQKPELALPAFVTAGQAFRAIPGAGIQRAQIGVQLSAFALSTGNGDAALRLIDQSLPAATAAQNASLMATLLMMRAEALTLEGRAVEAQAVRLDSLGWARYGFGDAGEIRARLVEIAAVTPENRARENQTRAGGN